MENLKYQTMDGLTEDDKYVIGYFHKQVKLAIEFKEYFLRSNINDILALHNQVTCYFDSGFKAICIKSVTNKDEIRYVIESGTFYFDSFDNPTLEIKNFDHFGFNVETFHTITAALHHLTVDLTEKLKFGVKGIGEFVFSQTNEFSDPERRNLNITVYLEKEIPALNKLIDIAFKTTDSYACIPIIRNTMSGQKVFEFLDKLTDVVSIEPFALFQIGNENIFNVQLIKQFTQSIRESKSEDPDCFNILDQTLKEIFNRFHRHNRRYIIILSMFKTPHKNEQKYTRMFIQCINV